MITRRCFSSSALSRIERLVSERNYSELTKAICMNGLQSEAEWSTAAHSVLSLVESDTNNASSAAIIPSLLIATAASGIELSSNTRHRIERLSDSLFPALSPFDKTVFTIGCSQSGFRTPGTVGFVNRFLSEARETHMAAIPIRLIPSLLLAISTMGINNTLSWNMLLGKLDIETLSSHEFSQTCLAIATSRSFPISSIERIIDASMNLGADKFSPQDALCIAHSLTCLEVFHTGLFRSLLVRISNATSSAFDSDAIKLLKQIVIGIYLDEKARPIPDSISPVVLTKLDMMLDWSIPEPQRHHGLIAGEIQQLLGSDKGEDNSVLPLPVGSIADWQVSTAASAAIDRFYVSDVPIDSRRIFFHIDNETYADVVEGPLDPYLQVKHAQIIKSGLKLIWVRECDWIDMEWKEKQEFINRSLG